MIKGALDIIHGGIWHTTPFKDFQPFLRGLLFGCLFNHTVDLCPMLNTDTVCDITLIGLPFRESQLVTQHSEQLVVSTSEQDVSIKGLVAPVGYN